MCINHAFQELCATRKANLLPQTVVQHVILASAVSHPQIAAACVCIFFPRGSTGLIWEESFPTPSVSVVFALHLTSGWVGVAAEGDL